MAPTPPTLHDNSAGIKQTGGKIAVLTVLSPHSWIVINSLAERFGQIVVLNEERQSRWDLLRKRARKQGVWTVLGQALFVLFRKISHRRAQPRIRQIIRQENLNVNPRAGCTVVNIGSVNSEEARVAINENSPAAVIVLGTRIVGRATREAVNVPLINIHAGINPKYRGQAGGYWALAAGDAGNAGVTVHLIDAGVDTGPVLYQERFAATPADSFETYFYLQYAVARRIAVKAVEDALNNTLKTTTVDLPSQQFYHPTIWGYLRTGMQKGVW